MTPYLRKGMNMVGEQKENIQKAAGRLRLSAFLQYEKYTDHKKSFEDNLSSLLEEQIRQADICRLDRRVRYAGFPQVKTFDTFVMSQEHLPNLNFDELRELGTCAFIDEKNDVVAIGPAGRGKTHAALAIGYEAVKRGYSVKFKRASDLVNEMAEAKSEKHLADYIRTLNRCQCLILDEVGYLNYDLAASSLLFQVVSTRYEKASTVYTTNLSFSSWTQFIPDKNLAAAIVDRIAHHAIILNMNGPKGWRLEHARSKRQRGSDRASTEEKL
jgi:DNA replication protein DnaC